MHNTLMDQEIRQLYDALFDIMGLLNQPQRDAILLAEADISLDRALFPLLVLIGRRRMVGIVELAGLVGRNYTTVSRQVAKLVSLGLVTRSIGKDDGREHKVTATPEGMAVLSELNAARERLMHAILAQWNEQEWKTFVTLLRRFADDVLAFATNASDNKMDLSKRVREKRSDLPFETSD
jgi:DNA-binding MarR family transcriptional regulator